jgi:hypothetical protein
MLKQGFLKKVSDYVAGTTVKDVVAMEKATRIFQLEALVKNETEEEGIGKIVGLFSEWLVFDYTQKIFDGMTGLQYFTSHNPLHLSDTELNEYKDMLTYEVGLFEVKNIEKGRGIILESIATGTECFVHDISASLSLQTDTTVWARISAINGIYHIVSSSLFMMPIKIMLGMKAAISGWEKNSYNAKEIVSLVVSGDRDMDVQKNTPIYSDAEERFVRALKKCDMDTMFSVRTYKKWVTDEKQYGPQFTTNALLCLVPTHVADDDTREFFDAAMEFANIIPRKNLGGKIPTEMSGEISKKVGVIEMNFYSKDKYVKKLEKAQKNNI